MAGNTWPTGPGCGRLVGMTHIAVQLYSLRDLLGEDQRDATLSQLSAWGLTEVEAFAIDQFDWLPDALARHGLTSPTAHANVIGPDQAKLFEIAGQIGCHTIFQPYFPPEKWASKEGIDELASLLNDAAVKGAERGVKVGYHNHDFEFAYDFDGVNSFDYFVSQLADEVDLEIDTMWVSFGGQDVLAWLDRLGDKVTYLHVKDGLLNGNHEEPNLVLGTGEMDVAGVLESSPGRGWVLEFDDCATDMMEAVGASIAYINEKVKNK